MKKIVTTMLLLLFAVWLSLAACGGETPKLETPSAPRLSDYVIHFDINGEVFPNAEYAIEVDVNETVYKLPYGATLSAYDFGTGEISVKFKRLGLNRYTDSDWSQPLTFTVGALDKPTDFVTKTDRIEWNGESERYQYQIDGKTQGLHSNSISASSLTEGKTEGTYTIKVRKIGLTDGLKVSPWQEYSYTIAKFDAPVITTEKGEIYLGTLSPAGYEISIDGAEPYTIYSNKISNHWSNNSAEIKYEARRNASGFFIASDWTEYVLKRTKLDPVTNIRVIDGVVYWDEVSGATQYSVRVKYNSEDGFLTGTVAAQYSFKSDILELMQRDAQSFYIEVFAKPFYENYHLFAISDYVSSEEILFDYSLDVPILDRIERSEGSSSVTVYWSSIEWATEYYLVSIDSYGTVRRYVTDCFASASLSNGNTAKIFAVSYSENKVTISVSEEFNLSE